MDGTEQLDAFLAAFREDWIKAGPPSPAMVIAMVNEIERLRRALAMREGGAVAELARGIQIAHAAWLAMGAPGAWGDEPVQSAKHA